MCAALISALVIRNQTSFEQFLQGYSRTYLAAAVLLPSGRAPLYDTGTPSWVARPLKLDFPEIEAISRVANQAVSLRYGEISSTETISWADPDVFDVLQFPVFAGDLRSALRRPDAIVLTRSVARKYFKRDDPIGESITLDSTHPMTVTAIIEDL